MRKSSAAEVSHTLDSHGSQVSTQGDGGAASASREIFQSLFKDLGKQAMAMESILRLVCGKVDKLESWVTEMSFGMTELDLQLRNIAHNIEGTAANVDDVSSASRWAVPQEQDDAPTATVVKKVGVGLNKKKQMRMTGMVANILDQLTAVAETPPAAVESESESHKGDDKKKAKAKAKKARGSVSGMMSPPSATSAATTPRAGETAADKAKTSKKKAHKHADAGITEEPATAAATTVGVDHAEEEPIQRETAVAAEDLRNALEDHVDATVAEQNEGPVPPAPVDEADLPHAQREEEPSVVREADAVDGPKEAARSTDQDAPIGITPVEAKQAVDEHYSVNTPVQERGEEPFIDAIATPNDDDAGLDVQLTPPANEEELTQPASPPLQHSVDASLEIDERTPLEITEEPAPAKSPNEGQEIAEKEVPPQPDLSHEEIGVSSVTAEHMDEQDQQLETHEGAPVAVSPVAGDPTSELNEASAVASLSTGTRIELPDTVQKDPARSPPCSTADVDAQQKRVAAEHDTSPVERPPNSPLPVESSIGAEPSAGSSSLPEESTLQPVDPNGLLKKSPSKKLRRGGSGATNGDAQLSSPTKRGSQRASIRKSITQRQTSIKRRQMQEQPVAEEAIHEAVPTASPPQVGLEQTEHTAVSEGVVTQIMPDSGPLTASTSANVVEGKQQPHDSETTPGIIEQRVATKTEEEDEDDEDDDDDDEDSSSLMGSDSDESVLDLDERVGSQASSKVPATAAEKKMSMKMTRTLSALTKLKKAEVLSPEEIAELKQRANQKWFKLRDHVKEKNKKDVANILLKRKKNIFTVSNRIELLEEKSREVYASIKQLNTELKGKVEAATFEGLRRHVHDIHVSLQVLDDKISKGNTPAMDHIKQLAKDTEAMRLFFLEQLELARAHCDANHGETITLFEAQWQRVLEIEKSIRDKLTSLVTEYDDKLHDLPDYTDALEGIRRAVRKKADLKALRELETRLHGHDAEAEDCLVRCLSCHKEVVNAGHETSHPQNDSEPGGVGSPHFKRVNPGTSSARVYRSNVPLNAQPIGVPDVASEHVGQPQSDDPVLFSASTTESTSKSPTPSRTRTNEARPSPLSFIHVTATRAISASSDGSRPISAPVSAVKKKSQPRSGAQQ